MALDQDTEVTKWNAKYWTEYVAETGMSEFMGAGANSIFQTNRELIDGGKDQIIPLVGSLKGKGTGAGLLTGAEESLDSYAFKVQPVWRRNAVKTKKSIVKKNVIDVLNAQKDVLKLWSTDDMRERMVEGFSIMVKDDTRYNEDEGLEYWVPYAEATAGQRNTWLTNNPNRALFGITPTNLVAGNMASSLATVDTTADLWSAGVIDAAKSMARKRDRLTGRRAVRPHRNGKNGREYFVLFVASDAMTQLRRDPDIKAFNKDSIARENEDNPFFQGGDLIWNGVVIRELPELPVLAGVGASSANVAPGYLCGAQAMVISWGQDPKSTKRTDDDYQFIIGVGTEELRSIAKTFFQNQQHGVVSVFAAVQ